MILGRHPIINRIFLPSPKSNTKTLAMSPRDPHAIGVIENKVLTVAFYERKTYMKKSILIPFKVKEQGGIALEYLIVSAFALALTLASIAYITKVIENKFTILERNLGVPFEFEMGLD